MMYPGPFKALPMGFHYPGHQQATSFYQSLYAGYNGQVQASHENAALAFARPYPLGSDPYALTAAAAAQQSAQHSLPIAHQYAPPVPPQHGQQGPSQNHDFYGNHGSKGKRCAKETSVSPCGGADRSLYSDAEKSSENCSGSQLLALKSPSKREDLNNHDSQQQSHGHKNTADEVCTAGDDQKDTLQNDKRKSRSKQPKKTPPRHNGYPQGNSQGELPPEVKAQMQAIQESYSHMYREASRREDPHHKQAKRTARLPQNNEYHPTTAAGRPDQVQSSLYPPYHPYQTQVPQGDIYNSLTPYNASQARSNGGVNKNPLEREIQRLRHHIRTLETELNKLQKKVNRSGVQTGEITTKDGHNSKQQRSKRSGAGSPRQTPVIVEMTNTSGGTIQEVAHKKHHHHRTRTHEKKQGQQIEKIIEENIKTTTTKTCSPCPKSQESNSCDCTGLDTETKSSTLTKQLCEETAAQLAYAVEARINARPQAPPVQYQYVYQQDTYPTQSQQSRELSGSHQRTTTDSNYNYSNNNELVTNHEERYNRSAEKILDAFERFYKNIGRASAAPMKVKYIPEDNNSTHFPQRNMNYISMSRNSDSPSSIRSNSDRTNLQGGKVKTIYPYH